MRGARSSQITAHAREPRIGHAASRSSSGAHKDRVKLSTHRPLLINSVQLLFGISLWNMSTLILQSLILSTVNQASLLPPLPDPPQPLQRLLNLIYPHRNERTFSCLSHRFTLQLQQDTAAVITGCHPHLPV